MSKRGQTLDKLRDQTDDDLAGKVATDRDELFRLQLGQYTNQVTSTAGLRTKRRDIARALTVLRARKLGVEKHGAQQKKAPKKAKNS